MAILTVGPTSTFPTIAAAMAAAGTGDILSLEAGYGNENATVTVDGLSFDGGPSSTDINLQLATGVGAITLLGTAPINVLDGPDANSIVGNDGDNIITVSSGVDVVNAGNGTDRLIVDYGAATAPITGTLVNVTDGGTHAVTFTGVENFTISTGSGNDTLTVADGFNVLSTGAGNDTITAGNGHNLIDGGIGNDTITAGNGANTIDGGAGNDTIVAGNGGNTINGGDGDDGITTGSGNDVVNAGLGNDTVITGAGNDVTTVNGGIDTVDSGSGTDRLIIDYSSSTTNVNGGVTGGTLAGGYDGAFADVAGTSSVVFQATENFTVTTGIGNDVIATGDGADVLDGGAGSDQLNAGGGDDTLLIGLGSDALDGGAGTDTALFDGARADYQITDLGGGVIQSIDLRPGSPDGTDTLVNIEGFTFTDGTFDATTVLNDPPTLGGDLGISVPNGGTVAVTTADLTATDSDNTNAQLVYTVTGTLHGTVLVGGSAAASFTEADLVANAVSFQHDGSATNGSFTVSLTDGTATPQMATVLAAVDLPGNNAPVLGGDLGIAVPNGGTVVVTTVDLTATDSDNTNAQLVYTVTGAVHGAVLLDGSAATSFTEADLAANAVSFHHDGSATDGSFTVSLTDGTAAPQTATVDATVGDSPPTDITLSNATIGEYSADGTVVGTFTTADPDSGDSFSYALLDNAGDRFAINGSDLVVKNYILLDYEQHSSHSVAVEVTDSAGMTFDKDFTIGVNDINPETVGGPATDDTIVGGALVDNINGGGGNDLVIGGAGGDWLGGGAGDDQVIGGDGADALWGEDGNDQISGGPGDDVILGGAGNDILGGDDGNDAINAGDGNDTIFGGTGDDQLGGGAGDDTIVGGDGNDAIWGEDGNDIINAGPGNDIVLGGAGNDQIGGGTGNDDLRGEAGNDVIWGEDGDDIITGGTGDDTLIGGAGHDTFVFAPGDGHDTITDFTATGPDSDHIWLAGTDLHNFADVVSHESFNPATGATTISYNGTNTITINNQTQAQLTVDHFIFG